MFLIFFQNLIFNHLNNLFIKNFFFILFECFFYLISKFNFLVNTNFYFFTIKSNFFEYFIKKEYFNFKYFIFVKYLQIYFITNFNIDFKLMAISITNFFIIFNNCSKYFMVILKKTFILILYI